MDVLEASFRFAGVVLGWPLRLIRRRIDRHPARVPAELAKADHAVRLAFALIAGLLALLPFSWLVFR